MGDQVSDDDIIQLSNKYGLPPEIGLSLYQQESSGGRNTGTSSKGAVGGFQMTPVAARDVGVDPDTLSDPYANAEAGIKYAAKGYKATGTVEGTAAYYHAGPAFARKLQQNPDLSDGGIKTTDYVQQVAQRAASLKDKIVQGVKNTFTPKGTNMAGPSGGATADFGVDDMMASSGNSGSGASGDFSLPGETPVVSAPASAAPVTPQPAVVPQGTITVKPTAEDRMGAVMDQANDVVQQMMASSDALTRQTKQNLSDQVDGLRKEGDLAATASLEEFRIKSAKAAENAAELSRLGINASDSDSLIADISNRLKDNYLSVRQQRDEINARQNVGLFDDPMAYIVNQLALPTLIRQHNQTVGVIKQDEDYLSEATTVAKHSDEVNAAKYASTTAVGAAASADLLRTKANNDALKISDQLLKTDFDSQIRKMTALDGQARILSTMETQAQNRAAKQTAQEAAEEKANQQAIIDQKVAMASQILGFPGIAGQKDLLKQPKQIRDQIMKVYDNAGAQYATTPYDASDILAIANKDGLAGATKTTAAMLATFRKQAEVEAQRMVDSGQITDVKKVPSFVNQKMVTNLEALQRNPGQQVYFNSMNGGQNPFHIPDPDNMAKDGGAAQLKATKILQDAKKILPAGALTDSMIPTLLYKQIGQPGGYADMSEAAKDLSNYVQQGIAINNRTYHFEQWGIPPQTSYPVETNPGRSLGEGKSVQDISRYTAAMKTMLDLRIDEQFKNYTPDLGN